MAIELTKKDIAELSAIVQQNVEAELQGDKLQRMQAFGKEDGTIDTNGVLAFALSEAKAIRYYVYYTFIKCNL